MTQLSGLALMANAYAVVGWNQVAVTELPGSAWLGNAYIVASQCGGTRLQRPNCLVWLG